MLKRLAIHIFAHLIRFLPTKSGNTQKYRGIFHLISIPQARSRSIPRALAATRSLIDCILFFHLFFPGSPQVVGYLLLRPDKSCVRLIWPEACRVMKVKKDDHCRFISTPLSRRRLHHPFSLSSFFKWFHFHIPQENSSDASTEMEYNPRIDSLLAFSLLTTHTHFTLSAAPYLCKLVLIRVNIG